MKILINALILDECKTGLGVYTWSVLSRIAPLMERRGLEYDILCAKREYLPEEVQNHAVETCCKGVFDRMKILRTWSKNSNYDLVLSTTQHGAEKVLGRQIITIHDLMPLFYPKGRWHQFFYYKFMLKKIIKASTGIITVSESTKSDISKFYHVSTDKIQVFGCGAPEIKEKKLDFNLKVLPDVVQPGRYFVITGIHYRYKNIHSVVLAYKKYPELREFPVIILGNDKCKYGRQLKKMVKKGGLSKQFIFMGFVSDIQRDSIIANACGCVYPSLYEGFGLPLLEAMAAGVPIACSNSSSLPEVGGDAALYFDPNNIEDIKSKLIQIARDNELRLKLIARGADNVNRFNWDSVANNIVNYICNILMPF